MEVDINAIRRATNDRRLFEVCLYITWILFCYLLGKVINFTDSPSFVVWTFLAAIAVAGYFVPGVIHNVSDRVFGTKVVIR